MLFRALTAPVRVPGYFWAVLFFFAALTGPVAGTLLCFSPHADSLRRAGITCSRVNCGLCGAFLDTARTEIRIETLAALRSGRELIVWRGVPGGDLDGVERHLSQSEA